ncbi:MAG: hypothetical protein KJO11_16945 [Gemmatimonadetes bacterium]|nr:hypothetical protein [Gemmatimonadota bacterium]
MAGWGLGPVRTLGLTLAVCATCATPAAGQTPVSRPIESIDGFSIVADAAITLAKQASTLRAALETAGYVEVSWVGTVAEPTGWNYERDRVRVELRVDADSVRSITRIERGRADADRMEIDDLEARFRTWFGLAEDDCARRDGAVACTVRDDLEGDPVRVVTAQLSPSRTVVRATRLGDPGGG